MQGTLSLRVCYLKDGMEDRKDYDSRQLSSAKLVTNIYYHITPEAVPLSKKSANAETGVGVTSKP